MNELTDKLLDQFLDNEILKDVKQIMVTEEQNH